jgi:uncharacterized membrane protein
MPSWWTAASRRRTRAVGALVCASAFGTVLVAVRISYTWTGEYRNLVWNLVLAWVPLVLAIAVYDRHRRGSSARRLILPALIWLLFLPNAPYLLTDYKYLAELSNAPVWFDGILLTTFACTGLLLGFISLYLMQTVGRSLFGPAASWVGAVAVLGLMSFGVYLGRFERWNSWDVLRSPGAIGRDLLAGLADPLAYPRPIGMTVALGAFLTFAYLALYGVLGLATQGAGKTRS